MRCRRVGHDSARAAREMQRETATCRHLGPHGEGEGLILPWREGNKVSLGNQELESQFWIGGYLVYSLCRCWIDQAGAQPALVPGEWPSCVGD